MTVDTKILEELTNAHGPSGFEGPVRDIMRRELEPLSDRIEVDGIGSVLYRCANTFPIAGRSQKLRNGIGFRSQKSTNDYAGDIGLTPPNERTNTAP